MDPKFQVGNWRKLNSEETGCVFQILLYILCSVFLLEGVFFKKRTAGAGMCWEFLARLGISNKPNMKK